MEASGSRSSADDISQENNEVPKTSEPEAYPLESKQGIPCIPRPYEQPNTVRVSSLTIRNPNVTENFNLEVIFKRAPTQSGMDWTSP